MYVLGLNIGPHDAAAALLRDGELRWLVEQERISRRKHAPFEAPTDALRACLDAEGIAAESIDAVAIGWDLRRTPLGGSRRLSPERIRRRLLPELSPDAALPIEWVPHHMAHAASAYHSSGADAAAILVVDAAGEQQATTLARARNGRIEILREWPVSQSLGFFYGYAAEWAGFGRHWGAGKLMGLAAYGRPRPGFVVERRRDGYALLGPDGQPVEDSDWHERTRGRIRLVDMPAGLADTLREQFSRSFPYAPREGEDPIAYADFAASVQQALEEAALGLADEARRHIDASTLLLAGGVAMNCAMVGTLARQASFDRLYVPPVPTDAGVSLGAALVVASGHEPAADDA
jgi:carbamoyltransferase